MVEALRLPASDKTGQLPGPESKPTGFEPAVYQIGAEIKALRATDKEPSSLPPWVHEWEQSQPNQPNAGHQPESEGETRAHTNTPRSDGVNPSPEEKALIERNSATARGLFPDDKDRESRDAAYRYLMSKECQHGYPPTSEADMQLLQKSGVLDKLDKQIEEDIRNGLAVGQCVPTS
jgi:hypothetical protein